MSKARSPRGVCSTTIGISATFPPSFASDACRGRSWPLGTRTLSRLCVRHLCVLDQQVQDLLLAEVEAESLQVARLLQQAAHRLRRPARVPGHPADLRVDFRLADRELFLLGDRLLDQRP